MTTERITTRDFHKIAKASRYEASMDMLGFLHITPATDDPASCDDIERFDVLLDDMETGDDAEAKLRSDIYIFQGGGWYDEWKQLMACRELPDGRIAFVDGSRGITGIVRASKFPIHITDYVSKRYRENDYEMDRTRQERSAIKSLYKAIREHKTQQEA